MVRRARIRLHHFKRTNRFKNGSQIKKFRERRQITNGERIGIVPIRSKGSCATVHSAISSWRKYLILDRYYWSNAAYQGGRGANYLDIIAANESFAPIPDLILVLDVEVDAGSQRIRMRGDKPNLFEGKAALMRARQIFLQLVEQHSNARRIDTSGHMKPTFQNALMAFQEAALNKIASSGSLHPEMVNLVLDFFGGERITDEYPVGTPEMNTSRRKQKNDRLNRYFCAPCAIASRTALFAESTGGISKTATNRSSLPFW